MDEATRAAFVAHVKDLLARSLDGDEHATKSLACMALLVEGYRPTDDDPGGCEIIDLSQFRLAA